MIKIKIIFYTFLLLVCLVGGLVGRAVTVGVAMGVTPSLRGPAQLHLPGLPHLHPGLVHTKMSRIRRFDASYY